MKWDDVPWHWFRNKRSLAISHGVADAIDGITRPHGTDTVYRPAYWQNYRRGYRDYLEARTRNQRSDAPRQLAPRARPARTRTPR